MHPDLRPYLAPEHEDEVFFTVLRSPIGEIGWMLSRRDRIYAWDGWWSALAVPLMDLEEIGDLQPLSGKVAAGATLDEVWAANRRAFTTVDHVPSLFADAHLGAGGLVERIRSGDSGERGITDDDRARLLEADPLAFLSLGTPEGMRALADLVE